jgi:hypothetical protein
MSLPFTTVTHEANEGNYGGGIALNCYFPMPFSTGARIEIVNDCDTDIDAFYFYIDYEAYDAPLPENVLRFHAHYRQEYPTKGSQGNLFEQRVNYWELLDTPNVSDAENYLILDAEGAGHYVGCVLSVDNIDPLPVIRKLGSQEQVIKEYTWWGEGDDMIFIDGEPWPPSLHGTGSEDYLCHAWGMHPKAYLYAGASIPENDPKHPRPQAVYLVPIPHRRPDSVHQVDTGQHRARARESAGERLFQRGVLVSDGAAQGAAAATALRAERVPRNMRP